MEFFQRYSWISSISAIFLQCRKQKAVGELALSFKGPLFFGIPNIWSPGCWMAMWLNLSFSSPRSFDTESEESRWVSFSGNIIKNYCTRQLVRFFAFLHHSEPVKYLLCTWTSPGMSVIPPTFLHPVIIHHVAPTQTFSLLLFCGLLSKLSHQPVLLFLRDPYLLPTAHGEFCRFFSDFCKK